MLYVSAFDRNQMVVLFMGFFCGRIEYARLVDAFVNSLDLTKYGVKEAAKEGRPGYEPKQGIVQVPHSVPLIQDR